MPKGVYIGNKGRPPGAKDKRPRMIAPSFEGEMTEQMAFRCTPEQRKRLEAFAAKHGITVAEATRRIIDRL